MKTKIRYVIKKKRKNENYFNLKEKNSGEIKGLRKV